MGQAEQVGLPFLLVAGLVGMLLLAIAIVLFFVVYQKRLMTQQEKLLRLEFDYQKELLNSSIQTQEVERKRIASDLHDSVGSQLSATKLYLKQIKAGQTDQKTLQLKAEALGLIEETILNIRQITKNLLPLSLERFGLVAAIEDLVERYNELGPLQLQLEYNEDRRLAVDKETAVYRIIQELLNNTLKHAEAQKVQISLEFQQSALACRYRDDGIGFDHAGWQKESTPLQGLGLKSIESRSNFLNAQLQINTAKDQGMELILDIPLNEVKPSEPQP